MKYFLKFQTEGADFNSQVKQIVDGNQGQQSVESEQPQNSQTEQESQPTQPQQAQTPREKQIVDSLEKDPRWNNEKIWGKNPQKLWQDLKSYDKAYSPFKSVMSKHGLKDHAELDTKLGEYKEYANPESLYNKVINELVTWYQDPELKGKVEEFFNGNRKLLQEREASKLLGFQPGAGQSQDGQAQYQAALTPQMVQAMNELKDLKQFKEEIIKEKETQQRRQTLDNVLNEVEKTAKQYGLDDFKQESFIQELADNGIPLEQVKAYFFENSLPRILEKAKSTLNDSVMNNLQKNKAGVLMSGDKTQRAQTNNPDENFDDKINGILSKFFN